MNPAEYVRQHRIQYEISGLQIELDADKEIRKTSGFEPFLRISTEVQKSDVQISLQKVPCLSKKEGRVLYRKDLFDVMKTDGLPEHHFHDHQDRDKIYAVRSKKDAGHVRITYTQKAEQYLADENNVFFHLMLEDLLYPFDRMIIHASYIRTMYGGILFSGPSGIGKSTQAGLWVKYRDAEQINGDKPILRRTKDDGWYSYGSPYAGSSRIYRNEKDPIRTIVLLEQGERNAIRRLTMKDAFHGLWRNMIVDSWNRDFVSRALDFTSALSSEIPIYHMVCRADEKDVDLLDQTLRKEE